MLDNDINYYFAFSYIQEKIMLDLHFKYLQILVLTRLTLEI